MDPSFLLPGHDELNIQTPYICGHLYIAGNTSIVRCPVYNSLEPGLSMLCTLYVPRLGLDLATAIRAPFAMSIVAVDGLPP